MWGVQFIQFSLQRSWFGLQGGGGGGGGRGYLVVIVVRVSEPVFRNLSHSYTWPLKIQPHSYTWSSEMLTYSYTVLWFLYPNVSPIHKKDEKSLPSNYRSISLLSSPGKVIERCVHKHLYNCVTSHQLLTPLQSGFVQGDSTTYQLLHTYHTFCETVDKGKEVRAVFCDISKAFDRVWHKGLLHENVRNRLFR